MRAADVPLQRARSITRSGQLLRPPWLLRAVAFGVFFFPSSMIIEPLGATGTVPLLLAAMLAALWLVSALLGLHDPIAARHPGRVAVALLLLSTCASYAALYSGWTGGSTAIARAAGDRWLILVLVSAGIVFVTAEVVRTVDDALVLVRALLAGAFFCCLVALVQFYTHTNPMVWVQQLMPGFTYNGGDTVFQERGYLMRVSGSTFHSIELAVVCAMLLPLSIWRGLYDRRGSKFFHWMGTALLVFAIAATISRSGVLGAVVGLAVLVGFLPRTARQWMWIAAPFAIVALFLAVPGLLATLGGTVRSARKDASITTRTDDYPLVTAILEQHPLLGVGPGNYQPESMLQVLDNQFLGAAVTMGVVGLVAVAAYLLVPGIAGVHAARMAKDPSLRCLAGALGASGLVAGVCSLTFDSLSFPVFALAYPMVVGLGGAAWIMVKREYFLISPLLENKKNPEDFSANRLETGHGPHNGL